MNIIRTKWVFKIKRDGKGIVTRYKVRLVVKGFQQEYGIDYHETFAAVAKYKSIRILLVLSVINGYDIEQLDVKTAFLYADVTEDIYIELPDGLSYGNKNTQVLKLIKALYGLKQAPREWHTHIHNTLTSMGFKPCIKDTCIYTKLSKKYINICFIL